MTRATATFTATVTEHFERADLVRVDYILVDILQCIEYIAQTHEHRPGTANDGAPLTLNEPEEIMWRLGAA